jgi:hypothetical protein
LSELKETDALGADLAKVSSVNNQIIKETLAIYFEILKQKDSSPLLRSVFLGIPQFCKYVNVEIIFDLLSVMREYFKVQIDANQTQGNAVKNISNVLAGLLCAFQILETGAASFEMDEKDFINTLYSIV